jgi:hypothetical protein
MGKAKTKERPRDVQFSEEAKRILTGEECEIMCHGLLRVIKNPDERHV